MEVISFSQKRKFSLEEAQELLPIIYRITEVAQKEVKSLANRIDAFRGSNNPLVKELENNVNAVVDKWQQKVTKLGATPKGLWLADFDNGEGYYCWKFPETKISFWHGYNDGFSGRKEIAIDPELNH